MHRFQRLLACLLLVSATIGCDRMTKQMAETTLAGRPGQSFLAGTVRLEYAENAGGFLSLGAEWPPAARKAVFIVANGLILVGTVVAVIRLRWAALPLAGLALAFAGGASNLIDRIARGSVIDFLNVGIGPVRTGIFNVADIAVFLGIGIVLLTQDRPRRVVPPELPVCPP
jgi:signal peptidase II